MPGALLPGPPLPAPAKRQRLTSNPTLISVPLNQPLSSQMRGMKGQAQDSRAASDHVSGSSSGATQDSRRAASSQARMKGMSSGNTR